MFRVMLFSYKCLQNCRQIGGGGGDPTLKSPAIITVSNITRLKHSFSPGRPARTRSKVPQETPGGPQFALPLFRPRLT